MPLEETNEPEEVSLSQATSKVASIKQDVPEEAGPSCKSFHNQKENIPPQKVFTPEALRPYPKTNIGTKQKGRKRQKKSSEILTSTPTFKEIQDQELLKEVRKQNLNRSNKNDSSDTESNTESLNLTDSDEIDWAEEPTDQNDDVEILVGSFILVKFATKKQIKYCVGQVTEIDNRFKEYSISFLRKRRENKFSFPDVPDESTVTAEDVHSTDDENGEKLWINPRPSSTFFCSLIKFTFVKENKEVIKNEEAEMNKNINKLTTNTMMRGCRAKRLVALAQKKSAEVSANQVETPSTDIIGDVLIGNSVTNSTASDELVTLAQEKSINVCVNQVETPASSIIIDNILVENTVINSTDEVVKVLVNDDSTEMLNLPATNDIMVFSFSDPKENPDIFSGSKIQILGTSEPDSSRINFTECHLARESLSDESFVLEEDEKGSSSDIEPENSQGNKIPVSKGRKRNSAQWKKDLRKRKRAGGEEYLASNGNLIKQKVLGSTCCLGKMFKRMH
ncbi:hypothetical protein NQ315_006096 [Exocentrus adspersus]|uniref:Uncharacterized protein n=1 Tax=Exocentrus adspersus TaxID=1586481 RepID=A0AAV8VDS0_9CUCU|nr:hypothetical protein NQ315_006096 [Exocentrus adspersus]